MALIKPVGAIAKFAFSQALIKGLLYAEKVFFRFLVIK